VSLIVCREIKIYKIIIALLWTLLRRPVRTSFIVHIVRPNELAEDIIVLVPRGPIIFYVDT